MHRIAFGYLLLLFPFLLPAQSKLSMADAIMKGRSTLAPSNLRQLQWIPGTSQFTHVLSSKIVRVNAANLATDTLSLLPDINAGLAKNSAKSVETLPALNWINQENYWFTAGSAIYTGSTNGTITRKNWYPETAESVDIESKTYKVAYTLNNGLFVNIGGKDLGVAQSEEKGIVYGKSVPATSLVFQKARIGVLPVVIWPITAWTSAWLPNTPFISSILCPPRQK